MAVACQTVSLCCRTSSRANSCASSGENLSRGTLSWSARSSSADSSPDSASCLRNCPSGTGMARLREMCTTSRFYTFLSSGSPQLNFLFPGGAWERAREPPDLFWWDQVHVSLTMARQVDWQAIPFVTPGSTSFQVDLSLRPDTTNIKLVARS